jgi:hypothetical protein
MATLTTYFTTQAQTNNPSSRTGWDWSLTGNTAALDGSVVFQSYPVENFILSSQTDFLDLTDIAIKLPDGAQIQGVSVRIFKSSGSDFPDFLFTTDLKVQFIYNGALRGQDKADTTTLWTDPGSYATYGGSTDLWNYEFSTGGDSLTSSYYVNQSFFGLRIAATFAGANTQKNVLTLSIDHVEINFYYTESPIETPGIESGQIQSNVNKLAPGGINFRLNALVSSNNLSNVNRLVATNRFDLSTSVNLRSPTLPITHYLSPIAKIYATGLTSPLVGSHRIYAEYDIQHLGISSLETISNGHILIPGNVNIEHSSITSEESLTGHRLFAQANIYHQGFGVDESVNNPTLIPVAYIYPGSTDSTNIIDGNNQLFSIAKIYHISPFDKPEIGWSDGAHGVYLDPLAYIYVNNHAKGQPGYSPFTSPVFNNDLAIEFPLNIYPEGLMTNEVSSIHFLGKTYGEIYPPGIINDEIDSIHQITKEKNIYPPPISDNNKDDGLGLHELLWKRNTINFFNSIYSPAYEVGYFDCMALTRDVNNDPQYDLSYNSINTNYLFSVDNINMQYAQQADASSRYAGEGAVSNTFKINKKDYSLSFTLPIKIESWGYVDNVFAALYDYCLQGYKGTPTSYVGRLTSSDASIGATNAIKIDNISDFITLDPGTIIYTRSDDNSNIIEGLELDYVSKSEKVVYFTGTGSTQSYQTDISYLWSKPETDDREPSFSLFSLREGLISGCMVDKISMTITPGNSVVANVDMKFTNIDREYQKNILANFNSLVANINKRKPNYLLSGAQFRLYNTTSDAGYFNLGLPIDRKVFRGFQETDIKNFEINEITIDISNNLEAIYTLNSKSSNEKENSDNNLKPYGYYSNGRTINGTITYSSPIKPWLFAEKLSGPSSINNGGIIFDFGPFKMNLPQIVWSPQSSESSMEKVHQKKVNWAAVTNSFVFDPYLEPTGIF